MKQFIKKTPLLLIVLWALVANSCMFTSPEQKPNIVLILTDDQGWGDMSFHGNDTLETPILDKFAQNSIGFDRFYVSPVCAPTRASLLTGRYHLRTGTSWVTHGTEIMRSEETTLAEILKDNNYKTGCFGKWHNGSNYPNDPNGQGFDEFFGFTAGHWNNYFNTTLQHNHKKVQTKGYIADVLTNKAIEFITNSKEKPFFCYIPYNTPHSPFQVPDSYFNKYKRLGCSDKNAAVYGMVENIDDNTNRILKTLDSLNLTENTIVIFMSDNGPNGVRYNGGMKGIKAQVDEGGVRVPFYIRFPRKLKNKKNIHQFAAHIDILPTILDLCDINLPKNLEIDGKSLVPEMLGAEEKEERLLFTHQVNRKFAKTPGAVRSQEFLLTMTPKDTAFYNLIKDPNQKQNIINQHSAKAKEFMQAYDKWFIKVTQNGVKALPLAVGYQESPKVYLEAQNAKLLGKAKFQGREGWANDWITDFSNNDSAVWNVNINQTAKYKISMQYACAEDIIGLVISVGTDSKILSKSKIESFLADTLTSPDRVKRGEVYERTWGILDFGEILLPKGITKINLIAGKGKREQSLAIKSLIIEKL